MSWGRWGDRERERGGAKASRSWKDSFGVWSNRGAGAAVRSERTGAERVGEGEGHLRH